MNIIVRHIIIFALAMTTSFGYSQTIQVKDPNFRQFLVNNYPSVMNGSQELDTALAQTTVNGTFDCSNQNLTDINEIIYFKLIDTLIASNNQLDSMDNIKQITSLEYIDVSNNQLRYLPDVRNINTMKYYDASNNLAEIVPWMNSLDGVLEYIDVSHNNLTHVYDFTTFANLNYMNISYNNLTFRYLLRNVDHPSYSSVFIHDPQKEFVIPSINTVVENSDFSFHLDTEDDTVTSDEIIWYHNNIPFDTTTSDSTGIPNIPLDRSGIYHATMTSSHPNLAGLVISTTPMNLTVTPCIDLSNLSVTTTHALCDSKGALNIDTATIIGGTYPYNISIINKNTLDTITNQGGIFENLSRSGYFIQVNDALGCFAQYSGSLGVSITKDCQLVLSPNGDGDQDEIYIAEPGKVELYNRSGKLITSFTAPVSWNGSDHNGQIIEPGYYVLYINGKRYNNITLLW